MSISIEQLTPEAQTLIRTIEESQPTDNQMETLKSLIIKTAEIVRTEMQEITTQLQAQTTALSSQFGVYEQTLESTITATAEGILQDYGFAESIQGLQDADGNFDSFVNKVNQYIWTGKLSDNPVRYGIAIGEGVTAYDQQGNPYLNDNAKCATFSMDELAFWQGNVKLAYFSSGKFYINNGQIVNSLQIGNYLWKVLNNGAIALMKD